ncbi:MAG: tetratricopeptide repeat protein [Planctomycetes bacterium]|nr:tetratricopeptide repeat protein [Planctomycetota bacterium]
MKLLALCLAFAATFTPVAPGAPVAAEGYEVHVERRDGEWWCSVHAQRSNLRELLRSLAIQLGVHVEGLDAIDADQEVTVVLEDRELRDVMTRILGSVGCQAELRTNALRVVSTEDRHEDVEQLRNLAVATYLNAQRRWPDHPGAVSAKLAQARIEEARGNLPAAIAHYETLIQRHRDSDQLPDALWRSAELLAAEHEWASVVQRLTDLLRLDRRHPYEIRARLLLARAHALLGDHEHAFYMLDVVDTYEPAAEPVEIQRRQLIRARAMLAADRAPEARATLDYLERLGRREEFEVELLELRARTVEALEDPAQASLAWLRYGRATEGHERANAFTQAARLALDAGDELGAMFISRLADADGADDTALAIRQRAASALGLDDLVRPTEERDERLARARRLLAGGLPIDALGVIKPIFELRRELDEPALLEVASLYARALAEAKGVDAAIDALRSVIPDLHAPEARRAIYVLAGELYEANDRLDAAVEAYQGRL